MQKQIILCADDYGQTDAISQGILDLVTIKRLSAVSCLTTTPLWREQAAWLKPFHSTVDIGLHFNLTHPHPPLTRVMLQAFCRQLSFKQMKAAWHAQLDAFEVALGCLPDFIDGHQHVHQLPIVREALLAVYAERLYQHLPYVRVTTVILNGRDGWLGAKKYAIYLMGTYTMMRLLKERGVVYNHSFSGIYAFSRAFQYRQYFIRFLNEVTTRGLIMCHPGRSTAMTEDPLHLSRPLEYRYLISEDCARDCLAAKSDIKRGACLRV